MARARRGRGEGSISQRDGGRWEGKVSLGYDAQGKRIRKTVYGKTKAEVQEKLDALKHDALMGKPIDSNRITVAEHFEDWLRVKKTSVRSSTYLKYESHVLKDIVPVLGHIQLRTLDYRRINAFYEYLDEREPPLATRTIYDIAAILRSGLEDAVRKNLIPNNPGKLAAKRSRGDREARFLDQEELTRFLDAARGERLADGLILAVNTGTRPGEWLGLSWDAVDLDRAKLTVRQALHEESGKLFLGEVKTRAGRRTISLGPEATQALRRQRKRQLEEKLAAGGRWGNEWNLVFTDTQGGPLRRTNIAKRDMKRICERAQLDGVTLHTFRHTHASMLIYAGVDIKTVSRRLGHENITITLQTYGHLMPGQDEAAAEAMDQLFRSLKPPAKTSASQRS
jgi:integrase